MASISFGTVAKPAGSTQHWLSKEFQLLSLYLIQLCPALWFMPPAGGVRGVNLSISRKQNQEEQGSKLEEIKKTGGVQELSGGVEVEGFAK